MDLMLPPAAPKGKAQSYVPMAIVRELTPEDLTQVDVRKRPANFPSLNRIRHNHHHVARLVAEGRSYTEISVLTGFSPGRVGTLVNDPAFDELVTYYREQHDEIYADVHRRIAELGLSAMDEIQERLEEAPEKFSVGQLMDLMKDAMDRTLAPNKSVQGGGGAAPPSIQITFVQPPGADAPLVVDQEGTPQGPPQGLVGGPLGWP